MRISEEQVEAIRERWGLNKSYPEQYLIWLGNMASGNFGESIIRTGVPVREMIFEAIPVTIQLNVYSMILALLISVPLGIWAAIRRNTPWTTPRLSYRSWGWPRQTSGLA